jgi:transposase
MKYFAGLYVSLDETAVCIVDEDGIVVRDSKVASEPDDLHPLPRVPAGVGLLNG